MYIYALYIFICMHTILCVYVYTYKTIMRCMSIMHMQMNPKGNKILTNILENSIT